jgi:hypothetical protein
MDQESIAGCMNGEDGLAVVLTATAADLEQDALDAIADVDAARDEGATLDRLLDRARGLAGDVEAASPHEVIAPRAEAETRAPFVSITPPTWEELRVEAEKRLVARGLNPDAVDIDDLLDPAEVERIAARFRGDFQLRANLDRQDVYASITAGLLAALVDFLVVRIPADTLAGGRGLRDSFLDSGSPLTKWMHRQSLPHDNPLSDWCKASFDRVNLQDTGFDLPGSGGKSHRYHTLGHDPFLGLVFGTIDIMRGGLSGVDNAGHFVSISGTGAVHPFLALPVEILHLLSDVATRMGIPAPGWVVTGLLQFGSVGPQDLTLAETARQMYIRGYDCRHFLTMATSPAAAELFLRGYWGLRHYFDEDFADSTDHDALVAQTDGHLGAHPRYIAMTLIAHTAASAANGGKIAMYGPAGPYAFNYAQWLAFLKSSMRMFQIRTRSPSRVLVGHANANAAALAAGWPELDWTTDDAPALSRASP